MKKGLIAILFLAFYAHVNGQNSINLICQNLTASSLVYFNSDIPNDCVSVDEEEQTLFIDLQKIQYNLREVSLIGRDGSIVFSKDVSHSPVDAIVEVNLKDISKGSYLLELKSYVNSIHKRIEI